MASAAGPFLVSGGVFGRLALLRLAQSMASIDVMSMTTPGQKCAIDETPTGPAGLPHAPPEVYLAADRTTTP